MRYALPLVLLALVLLPACDDEGGDPGDTMDTSDVAGDTSADTAADTASDSSDQVDVAALACTDNNDCGGRERWCDLGCELDCSAGPCEVVCQDEGVCADRPSCEAPADCESGTFCHESGTCHVAECSTDGDCQSGTVCHEQLCESPLSLSCASDEDCAAFSRVCDQGTQRCVEPAGCVVDSDCAAGEICDPASLVCVPG